MRPISWLHYVLWPPLVAAGKKDWLGAMDRVIQEVARATGSVDQAPIVTPELVKKLIGLCFNGANFDDLTEGHPLFALAVRDHCSQAASSALTATACAAAEEYYDLATAAPGELSTT